MKPKTFNLLRWFSTLSLVTIALIGACSGYLLFRFLSAHLLERDAVVSMEFIQSISRINDPSPYFHGSQKPQDRAKLEEFFEHIKQIPDVLRANVYNREGEIVWSSDDDLVGMRFDDNDDLEEALQGNLVFEHDRKGKAAPDKAEHSKVEHDYLPDEVTDFMESYVPIWNIERLEVVGVVEVYKAPTALFQALNQGRWLVVSISAVSSVILYLILFWIVRRANLLIEQQQQALIEAEKLTAIGELTSSVTHNLRNPLAAIRSSAELGLSDIEGPEREYLEDIINEVDWLDHWVRELLASSSDGKDHAETAALDQVLQSAFNHFGQRLEKAGVTVDLQLPEQLPVIRGNPEALSQVVISLIANALEAMPEGGRLTVSAESLNGTHVLLSISDTGYGIPQQQLEQLFQAQASRKPGGLGVGLPLARRILQRYHGDIVLSSEVGMGTQVQLQFISA